MSLAKLPLGILFLLGVVAAPSPTLTDATYPHSKDGDISIGRADIVIPSGGLTSTPEVWSFTGSASTLATPESSTNHDAASRPDDPIEIIAHGRLITRPVETGATVGADLTNSDSAQWGGLSIEWNPEGTDIEDAEVGNPKTGLEIVAYGVQPPYPSPSGGRVTIEFTIAPEQSDHVTVDVFDVAGRVVRSLVEETLPRARYRTTWDGRNAGGRAVAAGTYFVRVQSGSFRKVEKVVMVR